MPLFKPKQDRTERLVDLMAQVRAIREVAANEIATDGLQSFLVEQDNWPGNEPASGLEVAVESATEPGEPGSAPQPFAGSGDPASNADEALLAAELQRYLAREQEQNDAFSRERGFGEPEARTPAA